jgi:diguanylate cyclase (GGDEF)-like protein
LAFQELLAMPAASGHRAVLFLDVNGFKRINDSIGHEAGDRVLQGMAERLWNLADPQCVLARISGDEFVFVLSGPGAEDGVRSLFQRIEQAMTAPFRILGRQLRIRLAMGYAVQDANDVSGETLVRQADMAMYEAKRQKVSGAVAYSAVIETASKDAALIERGLRRALDGRGELSVVYQPIITREGHLAHAEVLARWTSPDLGQVAPDHFIAVAEQAGLIVPLGHQLFEIIGRDLTSHPDLRVSINISPLQRLSPDFVSSVLQTLRTHGVDPGRIEIELTEAVLVDDPRMAAEQLEALVVAGLSTALDDFGKGYSSVGYLEEFHFSTLKVDRSFVARMRGPTQGTGVLAGMITMAHGLGLRVVVEGVETAQELEALRDLGCDLNQGYHVSRPVPLQVPQAQWLRNPRDRPAVA